MSIHEVAAWRTRDHEKGGPTVVRRRGCGWVVSTAQS